MKKKIREIIDFYNTGIWQIEAGSVGRVRLFLLEAAKKVILAVRFFTAKRVVSEAAALTYSTILAIVPIMAVVFAIAR